VRSFCRFNERDIVEEEEEGNKHRQKVLEERQREEDI
jgi:hypothetical protein